MNRFFAIEKKFQRGLKKTERQAFRFGKSVLNYKRYNRFLRVLGPGLVTGAADDDPSGIATYSQAGAAHGFGLLWVFPLIYPLLLAVQESCARIGAITGVGLAAVIKAHYNKKLLTVSVGLVVIANTLNIGADLGAMAATAQLFVDIPFAILAIFFAVLIVGLVVLVSYRVYAKVLKWLALTLLVYPLTVFLVGQDWWEVLRFTFTLPSEFAPETIYLLVGILGTTISPYLFFWDTSEVVEEEIEKHNKSKIGEEPVPTKRFLRNIRLDNFIGMTLASVTAWFIVIACASTLFQSGMGEIRSAADAARALEPLVQHFPNSGFIAKLIFSVGILGLGFLAVPVLAGSSSYAISEALGWKEGLHRPFHRARGFYIIIMLATLVGLGMNFVGLDPMKALIFTAVFNGIAAVPLLFLLAKIGNSTEILGEYKNGPLSNFLVRLTCVVMTFAALALLFFLFSGA